ncbi:uncharacterized protein LOC116006774 [Ipomoea triloba]|uniref:uncharacterized protein LOC116006774 n=1 Tax=Ipomoea triloba TaxID=35885 RepID=UPI00125D9493|nr:uncharacterized protein LOC116006774 [Ipomoea triloba]
MPPTLKALYTSPDKSYNNFRSCVRTYNNTFAFTSLGIHNYEKDLCRRNKGIYTFKVQGQIYHFINDLLPDGCPPRNLQLYFYDTDHEVENRVCEVGHLDEKIVSDLIEVMSHNPYAKFFRSLKDLVHSDEFSISLQSCPSLDQRIYNAPTTSQVAAVWIEDFEGSGDNRNIRNYFKLRKPYSEKGKNGVQYLAGNITHTNFKCVQVETQRLDYFRKKQQLCRSENFQGLVDSVSTGAVFGNDVGRRVILPSSFIGGPRDMRGRYMDAMSLVQNFGKPDFFLTITCNPNWPEIKRLLEFNDEAQNRPDLVARIKGFKLDNRWIVPYNPQLLLKFDCYINVEVCATIKSVKYIYKYIYKGHDRVRMSLADNMSDYVIDEIKEYQNAQWISPPEAAWRIYGFAIAELKPAVIQLQVHLENSQYINFYGHERIIHIVSREEACRTMLTEFFSMNLANEYAKMMNLLYVEFPCHFVWCKSTKSWKPRKQLKVIGRLVTVNPTEGERYYLQMLLMNVRAPTSFESLKTVNGYFAETFREAAEKLGLLSGDSIIEQSLDEALLFQMPSSLRKLFAMLLIFCDLSNPRSLWIKYKSYMCQDFLRNGLHTIDESESLVLKLIANNLHKMGKNLYDYNLVDTFTELDIATTMTHEIMYERSLEVSESDLAGVQKLNACQRAAFDTIIENVFANKGGIYFVDGPAGTGKTFLYRCLLATVRSRGFLALATATSGIAASILPGGRTAHSRFKLPLDGDDKHICNIGKQIAEARLLKECKLILWDEASMANRKIIESLDTSLKDIMECNDLFGGKVIVFGGDFRQTLPITTIRRSV